MRGFLYVISALAVVALAFWAYQQNYATQQALRDVRNLQNDIATQRSRLAVLRAEWAYLNRPDRLRDLAEINFDRLGLLPLMPEQFGLVDQVAYPPQPLLPITDPVETRAGPDIGPDTDDEEVQLP
ncbi:MAG: cell division protein FtsL [Pseudomonadota bacterium]